MKANPTTRNSESNRTVLMVDGHGQIRTIRKFHQKLRLGIALSIGAVLIAAGAGWLYIDGLQSQRELQAQIDVLRTQVSEAEHQKELLLARALKAEARMTPDKPARSAAPAPQAAPIATRGADAEREAVAAVKSVPPTQARKEKAAPSAPPPPPVKPEPVVSVAVEKLKVSYQVPEKAVATEFIIRNTGNHQAEGRAVVVLSAAGNDATPHLTLPPVPLKNDRPRGNRGRRFSITRFMRLNLQRKVAEPGLRYDTADVFVFDMQGKLLQEKTFTVAVSIPEEKPPTPATVVSPPPPAEPAPAEDSAGHSILAIPSTSEQEPQGGQKD